MNKGMKIITSIIIIVLILLGGTYYALMPEKKVSVEEGKIITIEQLIKESSIDNFEISKKPLGLQGKISITSQEFKDIVYSVMKTNNITELEDASIILENDKVKIVSPYKAFGIIDSQIEAYLTPNISDNNLNIEVSNLKLGKINLSDKTLINHLNSYKDKMPFALNGKAITIDKSYTYPIVLNNIEIKENKIILDLNLQVNNIIDAISKYKINIK